MYLNKVHYVSGRGRSPYSGLILSKQRLLHDNYGPGSVVGIATAYGLDGQEIESRCGRDFPHLSRSALRPTQLPAQWVPGLSWG